MNKILKTLRKHWTRVWLIAILLMFGGIYVTYAVYTEVSSVKRVVSTQAAPVEMFSSNCMRPDISSRRLSSAEYSVTVCNFDQDKPTIYNPSTISYTLHAELQVKQGDNYTKLATYLNALDQSNSEQLAIYNDYIEKATKYSIYKTEDDATGTVTESADSFTADNSFSVTLEADSLAAQRSSVDKYKVEIDPTSINAANTDIYVHVWAVPTEPANLSTYRNKTYMVQRSDTAAWTWSGSFNEQNCATVDYDFYNYVITGSGAGTVDILWDPEKFEINQFFFNTSFSGVNFVGGSSPTTITDSDTKYGNGKDNGKYVGWSKVTISVDSITKNRYELQLYKTKSNSLSGVTYTGENAATKYIACFFN